MGGAIATPIVSYELKTNNITSPSNAIDITVAIPANSDIGSIQIIVGETVPNNSQILGAINI
jgi:hypothetical protein